MMKTFFRFFIPIIGLGALAVPVAVVVQSSGGFSFFLDSNVEGTSKLYAVFRIVGLEAFLLLTFQILLGSFRPIFEHLYGAGKVLRFHIIVGPLVFVFVLSHPILYALYSGIVSGSLAEGAGVLFPSLPETQMEWYIATGRLALYLLFLSVTAALLRRKLTKWNLWRKIHFLNYIIFILIFFHSQNIGTDAPREPFHSIGLFAAAAVASGFLYRVIERVRAARALSFPSKVSS